MSGETHLLGRIATCQNIENFIKTSSISSYIYMSSMLMVLKWNLLRMVENIRQYMGINENERRAFRSRMCEYNK